MAPREQGEGSPRRRSLPVRAFAMIRTVIAVPLFFVVTLGFAVVVIFLSFVRRDSPLIDRTIRVWSRLFLAIAPATLEVAGRHHLEPGRQYVFVANHLSRRGEVCGLRWSDLDLSTRTLSIKRSIASVAGGTVVKDTKTHASRRIALDDATVAVLDEQRRRLEERAIACEVELDPDGYVFTEAADGTDPLHPDTITGRFTRVRKQAGLDGVRLHDLRHLHATQLLAAGVPVRTVSGRLGHANAATTLNVYAHSLEASDRQAADVIGGLLD
jgi:integrase